MQKDYSDQMFSKIITLRYGTKIASHVGRFDDLLHYNEHYNSLYQTSEKTIY